MVRGIAAKSEHARQALKHLSVRVCVLVADRLLLRVSRIVLALIAGGPAALLGGVGRCTTMVPTHALYKSKRRAHTLAAP